MWVFVFYGFYVGLGKLHCGATPPSVMVLFSPGKVREVQSFASSGSSQTAGLAEPPLQQAKAGVYNAHALFKCLCALQAPAHPVARCAGACTLYDLFSW